MTEKIRYEITIEKITKSDTESKAEVLAFYEGQSFHIQQGVTDVTILLDEGDVLIVLRKPSVSRLGGT